MQSQFVMATGGAESLELQAVIGIRGLFYFYILFARLCREWFNFTPR